jgi:hypothetical protein
MMANLKRLKERVLEDGVIDEEDVHAICLALYADAKIDDKTVEFLIGLRNLASSACSLFEQFLVEAVKFKIVRDNTINAKNTALLRELVPDHRQIDGIQRKLLKELRQEVKSRSPEFLKLYDECM